MDKRFLQESGLEVYTGTELVLKGALESGFHLLTGYPGSPVSDIFDSVQNIAPYLIQNGILAQIANNEALAAARLNGSQLAGLRSIAVMKSVGFHVAADALATGNMAKSKHLGGVLIVVGDDPWSDTTQVPVDSRRLSDHLFIPVLEPSTFQEIKDWIKIGFEISEESDLYITYLLTTYLSEGGGSVQVFPNRPPSRVSTINKITINTDQIPTEHTILLPPYTACLEEETLKIKFPLLFESVRKKQINQIFSGKQKLPLAFVAAGESFLYLQEALNQMQLTDYFTILKLGMTYPIDPQIMEELFDQYSTIIVVEEKRKFIELQIRNIAIDLFQNHKIKEIPKIYGKIFPGNFKGFPEDHGLNPTIIIKTLAPLLEEMNGLVEDKKPIKELVIHLDELSMYDVKIPLRTPTFCPGCPHRDSSSVLLELVNDFKNDHYMKKHYKTNPIDIVFHGDAGCYSMLFMPPNGPLMHNYSGMGLGGGTGAGLSPFSTNKSINFLGDSTFFHSGWAGISDSIKNNQDILYIILDNKTTAMTGHQPHPGVDVNLVGQKTVAQDIEKVLMGLTEGEEISLVRINPENRSEYRKLLESLIMEDGVKFVIADKECGITFQRRKKRALNIEKIQKGYISKETRININEKACEFCLECTRLTGCPGLTLTETLYGTKMSTDLSWCVSDMACVRIKACPAFEEITIFREKSTAVRQLDINSIPKPNIFPTNNAIWRVHIAGVGGMGIGSSTAILVEAAKIDGFYVNFCDKKGIAIRNGGVYSQITLTKAPKFVSPLFPHGEADLLLGLDSLEAVRGLDPKANFRIASPEKTYAVVNTHKAPTILTLMGKDSFSSENLIQTIEKYTKKYFGADLAKISEDQLGNKLYVNAMLLGLASQLGLLPIQMESLITAIQQTFRLEEANENIKAFHLGRNIAYQPDLYLDLKTNSVDEFINQKAKYLHSDKKFKSRLEKFFQDCPDLQLTNHQQFQLVDRFYELIQYENYHYAHQYLNLIQSVYKKDSIKYNYQATKTTMQYLYNVMVIKDEVYVAHLLSSPEKYEADSQRFKVNFKNGDRVTYKHFNRPQFDILGLKIEFDLISRDWMLKIMKHFKFLRKILIQWHAQEKKFRSWYISLIEKFQYNTQLEYEKWNEVFALPNTVRGYRKIRYPKIDAAIQSAKNILNETTIAK
jgi:indolepyruvate ferredoxin oxidoreductase